MHSILIIRFCSFALMKVVSLSLLNLCWRNPVSEMAALLSRVENFPVHKSVKVYYKGVNVFVNKIF